MFLFRFRVIVGVLLIMGVTWMISNLLDIVGPLFYTKKISNYVRAAVDMIEILTAVLIFVVFVCKPSVWTLIKVNFPCLQRLACRLSSSSSITNRNEIDLANV